MKRSIVGMAGLLVLASCKGTEPGERFFASMNGGNELPPNSSLSSGTVNFTRNGDAIDYVITVQNITDVTHARLHAGDGLTTGAAIVDLYSGPTTGAIANGTLVSGTLVAGSFMSISMDSTLTLMRSGKAYVNITTTTQPNGEIRGQTFPN